MNIKEPWKKIKIILPKTALVALFIAAAIAWFPFNSWYDILSATTMAWWSSFSIITKTTVVTAVMLLLSVMAWRWEVIFKYLFWRKVIKKGWPLIALGLGCVFIKDHDLFGRSAEILVCFVGIEIYLIMNFPLAEDKRHLDSPIDKSEEEKLGRKIFVRQLAQIAEHGEYSRIAVTGSWGSGKTSCLNLVANEMKKSNKPIIRYFPWLYRTKEEAWAGFINAIDEGMSQFIGVKTGFLNSARMTGKLLLGIEQMLSLHKYGQLFNSLFMARLKGSLDDAKRRSEGIIRNELGDNKIIVFIDDLDRSEPSVVLEMLMLIKEVVDLRNCLFICGIDWDETKTILNKHFEYIDAESYLRKIYQLVMPIPEYKSEYSELFIKSLLSDKVFEKLKGRKTEILDILPYYGGTPRKIKEYLYEMNALEIMLESRYGSDDFNWKAMYIAGWLKYRYPVEMQEIINNGLFKNWDFVESNRKLDDKAREEFYDKHFVGDRTNKKQFHDLMLKLMQNKYRVSEETMKSVMRHLSGDEEVQYYFRVLDFPETLTWGEYRGWKKKNLEELSETLTNEKEPLVRRKEFMKMIIWERENLLSTARNSADVEEEAKPKLKKVEMHMEVMEKIIENKDILTLMDAEIYNQWIRNLWQWGAWGWNHAGHKRIRKKENEIAHKLTDNCADMASEILNSPFKDDSEFKSMSGETGPLFINEIREKLRARLANDVLKQFEVPEGIREYMSSSNRGAETGMLFRKDSKLYDDERMKKIEKLYEKIKAGNWYISKNIYEMFSERREYRLLQGENYVLRNDEIREFYWKCAVARKKEKPWLGELLKNSRVIIDELKLDGSKVMPIAEWMLEDDYIDLVKQYRPEQLEKDKNGKLENKGN